jgi:hypothetical protein
MALAVLAMLVAIVIGTGSILSAHLSCAPVRTPTAALAIALLLLLAAAALCQYTRMTMRAQVRRQAKALSDTRRRERARFEPRGVSSELRAPLQTMFVTVELMALLPQSAASVRLIQRLDACLDQMQRSLDGMPPPPLEPGKAETPEPSPSASPPPCGVPEVQASASRR